MGDRVSLQQFPSGSIASQNKPPLGVNHHHSSINGVENQFEIFLLFYLFITCMLKDFFDAIECGIDEPIVAAAF